MLEKRSNFHFWRDKKKPPNKNFFFSRNRKQEGLWIKIKSLSRVPVAHTCNLSYSGGRDQEDHGSKPAQANSSRDPILKIPNPKKGC
jgi:hypothetical protein